MKCLVGYRYLYLFIFAPFWLACTCCQLQGSRTGPNAVPEAMDSIYTLHPGSPSMTQALHQEKDLPLKRFARITITGIKNPAQVAISLELYYESGSQIEMLGSVSPFPADNPGSFLIATSGKLEKEGFLRLKLRFPDDWDRKSIVELKVERMRLE